MITVITDKPMPLYTTFIDECIMSLFPEEATYDIYFELSKFVDTDGTHAGFCLGDEKECVISLATHWVYEDGEEIAYQPHELASNIAHELVHAKQFYKEQINMIDNVWKHNNVTLNCDEIDYEDLPWEVEAYTYEVFLTDILWENV